MRSFLKDSKIATRIFALTGLATLLMILVIGLGLRQITAIGEDLVTIVEENIPLLQALNTITFNNLKQSAHLERAIRFGRQMAEDKSAKDNFEIERKNFLRHGPVVAQEIEKNRTRVERMCERHKTPEIRDVLLNVDYELRSIDKKYADYQFLAERVFNLLFQGKVKDAEPIIQKIMKECCEEEFAQDKALVPLFSQIDKFVEYSTAQATKNKEKVTAQTLTFSVLIFCASLGLGVVVARGISKPLHLAVNVANRISAGDRDVKIEPTSKDETGQLLETMKQMFCSIREKEESLEQQATQLAKSNRDLEGEVAEREKAEKALQAANRFLSEASKKLEDSNRELQHFAYIASHDLREPLRKISSFGGLLKESLEGNLDQDDQENLRFMVDGADRMNEMIEGLLIYSRLDRKESSFENVDLNEIIEQLEQVELAAMLEETSGTIEVLQGLPAVQGDPVQIRQLLQNLVANGIKYRREEMQPNIVITAKRLAQDTVRIEIQDNGIGIKEEFHGDIFAMFRRLHSRRKYEGTGIGLAVCKKIVEKHGGQIGVESKQGQGSTFWFTLPLAKQEEESAERLQHVVQG